MLKQRVLTGLVLAVIVLAAVALLPPGLFAAFIAVVLLLGAREWGRLAGLRSAWAQGAWLLGVACLMLLLRDVPRELLAGLLLPLVGWWVLAFGLILIYPRAATAWARPVPLLLAGLLVLLPGWLTFLFLRGEAQHVPSILLLLFAVAAADIGAYFVGRRFGQRKLAPRVSPNKTWEGFLGGMFACVLLAAALGPWLLPGSGAGLWLRLCLYAALLGAASVVGDLFESMLKRQRQVKDSGSLLPGHGGVLDRIDSITAAAPFYALMVLSLDGGIV